MKKTSKSCSIKNMPTPSLKPTAKRAGYPSRTANVRKGK